VQARAYVVLFGLALIWGASFLFIKVAVSEVSPATLVAGRLLCSVVVLGAVAVTRPALFKGWRHYWRRDVAVAAINYLTPYLAISWGETRIASGMASILNATTPLFTVLLAHWWVGTGREALTLRRVAGVVVGFVGVGVLVGPLALVQGASGWGVVAGELAVLLGAAAYAVGALLSRGYTGSASLVGPLGSQIAALILVAPLALLWGPPTHLPSLKAIGAIAALGAAGTGVAYLLYFWLINHVGATRTVIVTYLLPCTALIWGALLLGETVTWYTLAGLLLVLLGTMITNGTLSGLRGRASRRAGAGKPAPVPLDRRE
jgi:drug/metabolite transporter (DMT)-like permease